MSRQRENTRQIEFIAWIPDYGDEEDGWNYWDYPSSADDVAAEFAEDHDGSSSEYPEEQEVSVKNVSTGEVKIFTVYAETVRRYRAREKEKV